MASNHILKVSLITDDSKFKRGMEGAEKSASGLGFGLKALAAVAAVQLARKALTAVKDFATDSIRAFSDLNESTNAVNVTFGRSAEGIQRLAQQAARSVGLATSEYNSHAVSLSAFVEHIAGTTGDVVGTMDTLMKRVADFASVMNLDVSDALIRFRSGLAGESEPLRRFGIDVSAAKVEAVALAAGIWDGNGAMTEGEKIQGRYAAIMEQTAKTAGDFANTSDEMANKERILNAELENSKALLGEALAPAKQLFQGLQSWGVKALASIAVNLNVMTGAWTQAEKAAYRFQRALQEGRTVGEAFSSVVADSITELDRLSRIGSTRASHIRLQREHNEAIRESTRALLTATETREDALKVLEDEFLAGRLSQDQYRVLIRILEEEDAKLRASTNQHRLRKQAVEDTEEATDGLNEEIAEEVDLLEQLANKSRDAVSALDGLLSKTNDLTAAENDYNKAISEFGPESVEAREAAMGLLQARADAEAEWADFFTKFPGGFNQAFNHLVASGVAPATARAMVDQWQKEFNKLPLEVRLTVPSWKYTQYASGDVIPSKSGTSVLMQHGGIAQARTGGVPAVLAEGGSDEAVIPLNRQGINALSDAIDTHGGAAGETVIHVYVSGTVVTPTELVDAIHEGLVAKSRRNGTLGLAG